MIHITRSVDTKAGTITLRFGDSGYHHEFQGRPCHAIEVDGVEGDLLKQNLHLMGYEHLGCEVKPAFASPWVTRHIEYWAKPVPFEGE